MAYLESWLWCLVLAIPLVTHLPMLKFLHLYNQDNHVCFTGFLGGLNEVTLVKCA